MDGFPAVYTFIVDSPHPPKFVQVTMGTYESNIDYVDKRLVYGYVA